MARIAILGGTGYTGGNVAREALARNHQVISYSRSAPSTPIDGVEYRLGSVADHAVLDRAAADADVLVLAVHAADVDGAPLLTRMPALLDAVRQHGSRLGVVGGAGSSLIAEGGPRLIDTPQFHDDWKPEASAHADVLDYLRAQEDNSLNWFYVSPAALYGAFAPGERTGHYRTGGDVLVSSTDGTSEISGSDFALAFVDEIDHPEHVNQRFTVGH